jgi:hypothetical protein
MRCRNAVWERGHRRKELVREIDPVLLIVVIITLGKALRKRRNFSINPGALWNAVLSGFRLSPE